MGGLTEGSAVTDGVIHCPCIDAATPLGKLIIEAGKLLPAGSWMDGHSFDYGRGETAAVVHANGRRRAVRFDALNRPAPSVLAELLSWAA